jgi:hypothetical protein
MTSAIRGVFKGLETPAEPARQRRAALFPAATLSRGRRKSTAKALVNHTFCNQRKV